MKLRIYAAAIVAVRYGIYDNNVKVGSIAFFAANSDEATGIAMREAQGRWRITDGYSNHQVSIMAIPDEAVLQAAKELALETTKPNRR